MAKLVASTKAAPVGALITAEAASGLGLAIAISWGEETAYSLPGGAIGATNSAGIARLSHSLTNSVLWSRSNFDRFRLPAPAAEFFFPTNLSKKMKF